MSEPVLSSSFIICVVSVPVFVIVSLSVIVPVYNTANYLEKCLDSLLNQEYSNLEIIVVEDKSSDNSREVLKKYTHNEKIKIFYNEKNIFIFY